MLNLARSGLLFTLLSACAVNTPVANDPAATDVAAANSGSERAPPRAAPSGSLFAPAGEGSDDFLSEFDPAHAAAPETPEHYEDLWSRIAAGFRLQDQYDHPEVLKQIQHFAGRPHYFEQVGERARPFLQNIVEQIEERGLPMEVAMIPFVESSFNPYVRSRRAAAGPWQIMANTGRSLGLRVDEWFDGRRDPIKATGAALDYLVVHKERLADNWLLAFAAYNSGPATVNRAIRAISANPREVDFWDLPLPAETQLHVPRILALARILSDRSKLNLSLPEIANTEVLQRVKVGGSASIVLAAELAGLEPQAARRFNPGFRQWWTPPAGGPDYLYMPHENAEMLRLALRQNPQAILTDSIDYQIQPGDSLWAIARRYRLDVDTLARQNNISPSDIIFPGQLIRISPLTERLQ